jgi:hypothetical protein
MTLLQTSSTHFGELSPAQLASASPRPRIIDVREPVPLATAADQVGGTLAHVAAGLPVER